MPPEIEPRASGLSCQRSATKLWPGVRGYNIALEYKCMQVVGNCIRSVGAYMDLYCVLTIAWNITFLFMIMVMPFTSYIHACKWRFVLAKLILLVYTSDLSWSSICALIYACCQAHTCTCMRVDAKHKVCSFPQPTLFMSMTWKKTNGSSQLTAYNNDSYYANSICIHIVCPLSACE